ncbi:lantibiotic dehydratase C-terminal domain-containing protein [Bacillus sp. JCM 19034]|uniref:lantibiotic dehydratase C-terminal domain-containing protein n=1 Tax=Bacillus sp. JCM 19034 TaxID=1481928 RepID=UPI0007816ADD|nr:lantibiotic dehydratase C-terminal domain-containing protein [Bacillus sp. JCM 19034]
MWYSLHGFIHDFKAIDDYMKTDFQDVIREDMESYFFIRYWLGGPHVRLRFKCKEQDYQIIKDRFEASITRFITHHPINLINYDHFYQAEMLENENITETYWCEHGSVAEFQYEPEYNRYGGIEGMCKSEDVFYESSVMANQLNQLPFGKRIIAGLDLIYLSFQHIDEKEDIYQKYADFWKVYHQDGYTLERYELYLSNG